MIRVSQPCSVAPNMWSQQKHPVQQLHPSLCGHQTSQLPAAPLNAPYIRPVQLAGYCEGLAASCSFEDSCTMALWLHTHCGCTHCGDLPFYGYEDSMSNPNLVIHTIACSAGCLEIHQQTLRLLVKSVTQVPQSLNALLVAHCSGNVQGMKHILLLLAASQLAIMLAILC